MLHDPAPEDDEGSVRADERLEDVLGRRELTVRGTGGRNAASLRIERDEVAERRLARDADPEDRGPRHPAAGVGIADICQTLRLADGWTEDPGIGRLVLLVCQREGEGRPVVGP